MPVKLLQRQETACPTAPSILKLSIDHYTEIAVYIVASLNNQFKKLPSAGSMLPYQRCVQSWLTWPLDKQAYIQCVLSMCRVAYLVLLCNQGMHTLPQTVLLTA